MGETNGKPAREKKEDGGGTGGKQVGPRGGPGMGNGRVDYCDPRCPAEERAAMKKTSKNKAQNTSQRKRRPGLTTGRKTSQKNKPAKSGKEGWEKVITRTTGKARRTCVTQTGKGDARKQGVAVGPK